MFLEIVQMIQNQGLANFAVVLMFSLISLIIMSSFIVLAFFIVIFFPYWLFSGDYRGLLNSLASFLWYCIIFSFIISVSYMIYPEQIQFYLNQNYEKFQDVSISLFSRINWEFVVVFWIGASILGFLKRKSLIEK